MGEQIERRISVANKSMLNFTIYWVISAEFSAVCFAHGYNCWVGYLSIIELTGLSWLKPGISFIIHIKDAYSNHRGFIVILSGLSQNKVKQLQQLQPRNDVTTLASYARHSSEWILSSQCTVTLDM